MLVKIRERGKLLDIVRWILALWIMRVFLCPSMPILHERDNTLPRPQLELEIFSHNPKTKLASVL
jgi:hypothetical protein